MDSAWRRSLPPKYVLSGAGQHNARLGDQLHAGGRTQQLALQRPHHKRALAAVALLELAHADGGMQRVLGGDDGAWVGEAWGREGGEGSVLRGADTHSHKPATQHVHVQPQASPSPHPAPLRSPGANTKLTAPRSA